MTFLRKMTHLLEIVVAGAGAGVAVVVVVKLIFSLDYLAALVAF